MPIPRLLFTYWEGSQFSHLHLLTLVTLHMNNPHIPIRVYTSETPSHDGDGAQWKTREHRTRITQTVSPFESMTGICTVVPLSCVSDISSVVHRADYVRIVKLYEHGGMWFDFDILFLRPIPVSIFDTTSFAYHTYENTFPTGIVFASPNNEHVHRIYELLQSKDLCALDTYQGIGPDLWKTLIPFLDDGDALLLETHSVYPYSYRNIDQFFFSMYDRVREDTWGVHWYNGSRFAKEFINTFKRSSTPKSVCEKYMHMLKV